MSLLWFKIPNFFIHYTSLLIFFFEIIVMTGETTQTKFKVSHALVYQLSSEKQSSHYASLPAVFNPLSFSTDQEVFEKQLCNQRKIQKFFCYKEEAITCNRDLLSAKMNGT